jgi:hypothetical protein
MCTICWQNHSQSGLSFDIRLLPGMSIGQYDTERNVRSGFSKMVCSFLFRDITERTYTKSNILDAIVLKYSPTDHFFTPAER